MRSLSSQVKAAALELSVAATVGCYGIVDDGQPLAFTETNVRRLYVEFSWIREQVDAFVLDRANFLGN